MTGRILQRRAPRRQTLHFLVGSTAFMVLGTGIRSLRATALGTVPPPPPLPATPTPVPTPTAPSVYTVVAPGLSREEATPPPPTPAPQPDVRFDAPATFNMGDPEADRVYLTIDDCWSPSLVSQALEKADRAGAHLTFFPVGTVVERDRSLWREVLERGHAVENHTRTHRSLTALDDRELRDEITSPRATIEDLSDGRYRQCFLRPPGGSGGKDARVVAAAKNLGFKVALWSADSNGWRVYPRADTGAVEFVLDNVFRHFRRGAIVIQHAVPADIAALAEILAEAGRRGFECASLPEGIA
ncbi:MAG: hypothetical protein Kow0010_12300 [Dehalococcoidia bacterium]